MSSFLLLCVFAAAKCELFSASCSSGVFGESVSVMKEDSVTLNTDVTKICDDEDILWKYGAEKSLIAEISKVAGIFNTFEDPGFGHDGRFRLKLDDKTGSLTITNTRTEHAGDYELRSGAKRLLKAFCVSVYGE